MFYSPAKWSYFSTKYLEVPSDTAAVSLFSFDCGTAAVPVAQTELQATDTAAVARVTATCDTAAVSVGSAILVRGMGYDVMGMGCGWKRGQIRCRDRLGMGSKIMKQLI